MNRTLKALLIATVPSLVIGGASFAVVQVVKTGAMVRIAKLLGGDVAAGGYIQILTLIAFFAGVIELREQARQFREQNASLHAGILPEKEHYVVYADDVRKLQQNLIASPQRHSYMIVDMIIQLATKFLRTKSPSEVIEMSGALIRLRRDESEKEGSLVRYLLWLIPSLGFIGTVLGISAAMGEIAGADLNKITVDLGIAFDTTLVALVLSSILLGYYHRIQKIEDELFIRLEKYLLENFVNRLEV